MITSLSVRKRGRPEATQPSARAQILDALLQTLDSAPLSRPSLRNVAQAAAVSPALLHYHFDDLAGLMRCLLEERAMPLLHPALRELQAMKPDAVAALTRFLQKWTVLTLRHPWLAACLLQAPADAAGPAAGFGGVVRAAVESAQSQGAVRRDLPGNYIALLLLSLGVMPHLAQTALGSGMDPQTLADPENAATLMLQHLSVLQAGVARSHSPRQDSTS
jgi:AcrR family transcriptional regulator